MSIKLNIDINKLNIGSTQINKIYLGTQLIFGGVGIPLPDGQAEYTTPGSFSWEAPAGVTSVSVVAIGGGGNGGYSNGGSGAGLGWKNEITVIPGNFYTVEVGNVGVSYFIDDATVAGFPGSGLNNSNSQAAGGTYVGDGGGNGGVGGDRSQHGGGGTGGYSGNGGGYATSGNGGGAGGGGYGGNSPDTIGPGGGGVGIYGEGASGSGGSNYQPGLGGSGGTNGGSYPSDGSGGLFGGGGGGKNGSCCGGAGGSGAVRIIWGTGRAFPSTNTADI